MKNDIEKYISNWINQFESSDRSYVQSILNELEFVSTNELHDGLETQIQLILKKYKKIAIFPVLELCKEYKALWVKEPRCIMRREAGSSKVMSYFISQLQKKFPKKILSNPSLQSIKNEKIKAIVFMDDIIASGERVITHWKYFVPRTIKSWLSYGKCDLFFLSYVSMDKGIKNIMKTCKQFKRKEFLSIRKNPTFKQIRYLKYLCAKYSNSKEAKNLCGYGDVFTNIVFEGKCSNNFPPFLWAKHCSVPPLFPDRFITKELFEFFSSKTQYQFIEDMWDHGQIELAYNVLNEFNQLSKQTIDFLYLLALLEKKIQLSKIRVKFGVDDAYFNQLVAKGKSSKAIESCKISDFGKCLLDSYRKNYRKDQFERYLHSTQKEVPYIPKQYRGMTFV